MSIEWNRNSMTRFTGEALFVSGCLPCTDAPAFSFFDCTPAPQEPQISDKSDNNEIDNNNR